MWICLQNMKLKSATREVQAELSSDSKMNAKRVIISNKEGSLVLEIKLDKNNVNFVAFSCLYVGSLRLCLSSDIREQINHVAPAIKGQPKGEKLR